MINSPLVSIISPCYNGEKYLPDFLNSILAQTHDNIELIVVNDASTDGTEEILKGYIPKFADRRIQYNVISKKKNGGQAAAINEALPVFSGDYMMWMDSDDILYPDAIEKKLKFLITNPELDFCLCWGEIVNSDDLNKSIGILRRIKPIGKDNLFEDLIYCRNVVFCPGTIFIKSSSFKKVIPSLHIYESREGQNWQLMLPLAYSLKCGYIEELLFKYVVHNDSHSHSKRKYDKQIQRQNNFTTLIDETILNIDEIENKQHYYNVVTIARTKDKLKIAISHFRYGEYLRYKKILKTFNVNVPIGETFFPSLIRHALGKIKKVFKKA